MSSERPRRSNRSPAKHPEAAATPATQVSPSAKKRKAPVKSSHDDPTTLDFLLTNPKSPLVTLELSTLINERTWAALSPDSRCLLSTMLPPTAFPFFRPTLDPRHPATTQPGASAPQTTATAIDVDAIALASEPDPSFLTDPFFEAGARTFQDHLYSGWLSPAHAATVHEYTAKLKTGAVHAPWKDDKWADEHPLRSPDAATVHDLAGDASALTLRDLAKHAIVRAGDVLAYRRHFSQLNRTVAKDALIDAVHPGTHALTVLAAPAAHTHLPPHYLHPPAAAAPDAPPARAMTVTNPSQLESALLDMDATVDRARRPNGNAWKCIGVWRSRDGALPDAAHDAEAAARGGREYHGTLFYLRGCFYDDQ